MIRAALLIALLLSSAAQATDFREQQLAVPRVRKAYAQTREKVAQLFQAKHLAFPPKGIFLRVFKLDRQLELWGQADDGQYVLVKQYPICASSGVPGPKRREGDEQVPEGFYSISVFNPASNFHLSLGIDYPNASDRLRGEKGHLGGAIMIHGDCVTIGCVPITDELIEEVYIAAVEARAAGQSRIEAHFLPGRFDTDGWKKLQTLDASGATLALWRELKAGYDAFEQTHWPPVVRVDKRGRYTVTVRPSRAYGSPSPQ